MNHSLTIKRTYRIPNTVSNVWQSLVCPTLIDQYANNCEMAKLSTDEAADSLERCATFRSGDILEYEKGVRVKFSTFDANAGLANVPQNYIHITYELSDIGNETELSITIENFMEVSERFKHSQSKWSDVLSPRVESLLAS
ncbi:MAG: hypothetical protein RIG68_14965 [Imperialibacter sp.]|uniref:hypothetical protein n=1 Tax=Imperialibacter sp. TaxID=2038411 RepID=UPI0032EC396A